jgi:esterase/lipase superfamily enzyme
MAVKDIPLTRPAIRVGALGPPEVVAALGKSFAAEESRLILQEGSGEAPLDAVLLVVTAEEGVSDEVRRELRHLKETPLPVVVFLDGCDRVPAAQGFVLDLIEHELRGLAGEQLTILRGASGEGWDQAVHELAAALETQIPAPAPEPDPGFRLAIADLVPTRRGTVVLGRVASGRVRAGQEVEIAGSGRSRTVRVRGVLRTGDLVPEGRQGEEVGLFLESIRLTDFLGAGTLVQPAPRAGRPETEYFAVPVLYATDRERTGDPSPRLAYGAGRGELTFGVAEVSLPRSRRRDRPAPAWWRLETAEDLARHVVLLRADGLERSAFTAELRQTVGRAARPEALVFVHGYDVSFEDAARRAAQLADDLDLQGVPVLYSWPSEGRAHRYTADELNVEWTVPHFQELLRLVAAEGGVGTVHVVAHGMGSRALVRALVAPEARLAPLGQVVLAVPDMDRETFRGLVPRLQGRAARFTLYGSAADRSLYAARLVHSQPRAGEPEGSAALGAGLDVVDASAADTALASPAETGGRPSILDDLAALLRHGLPPGRRGLAPRADGRSWVLPA